MVIAEESGARSERTSDGWPDIPGDTALTIRIPEADPLVRAGFPAHVTVLYPFVLESRLDDPAHRDLSGILAGHPPFTLTFAGFGRYPGVLYLDPHPHAPVKGPHHGPHPALARTGAVPGDLAPASTPT